MTTVGPPASLRPSLLPRPLYACAGMSFLIAGAGVAAWNAARPFAHGWWLVSFLALVGGVAQALLGAGGRAVAPPSSRRDATAPRAALWNAGAVLVPLGVLAEVRLPVLIGSGALMAVLAAFAADVRRAPGQPGGRRAQRLRASFVSLLAFLAISVVVGTALAWHLPWA
jgi:hypothetical protein